MRTEVLMGAEDGSARGDELEILVTLIEHYEAIHFPIPACDPIEAIRFRMEQVGLTDKDLTPVIGSRSKVSEVLNRKRLRSWQRFGGEFRGRSGF